jgi:hypothetical protein
VTVLIYQYISVLLLAVFYVFVWNPGKIAAASAKANGDPNKPIIHTTLNAHKQILFVLYPCNGL